MLKKASLVSDFLKSFVFASRGLGDALVSERNFRVLWLCGLLIILVNYLIKFEVFAQIIFLLLIFIILALELVNSALEKTCDSLNTGRSILIKKAKDFSAAAVLLAAIGSLFIFGLLAANNKLVICEFFLSSPLFFVTLALIGFFNFFLCLKKNITLPALVLSIAALLLHIALLVIFPGSLFFLVLSLFFHASLSGAFFKQQNIC